MYEKYFLVVDLEATCEENDRNYGNEIIEIGAVLLDAKGKQIGEFDEFVRPINKPILTDFCMELTSIKQSDIDSAEPFTVVLQKFNNWLGDKAKYTIFCSWGYYDMNQIRNDCAIYNIDDKTLPWLVRRISVKHQFSKLMNKPRCGMTKALHILNIPHEGTHHRGIDDARNIAKILVHPDLFKKWTAIRRSDLS
ncbi:MAG: 3-5 exonuclease [Firmicutes bacterium]|nr:3-5 exonuclease [Bacillota bacterium]